MFKKMIKSFAFLTTFAFSLVNVAHAESVEALFHQASDPIHGNPNGKVTIVEFFDYQCSYCTSMLPIIDKIVKNNPNVRVVYKEYPIKGSISEFAARAALAANKQGKYRQFSRALLYTRYHLTPGTVFEVAEKVGLNIDQLKKDMESPAIRAQLNKNLALAEKLNVNGTPAFFIGKTSAQTQHNVDFIYGSMTLGELQSEINKNA